MKIVCDREKLREGLAVVNNVIPGKSTKPVLENVCLVATVDAIEILGTDLECSVRYRIPVTAGEAPVHRTCTLPSAGGLDHLRSLQASRGG